jgi:hypothetical protein
VDSPFLEMLTTALLSETRLPEKKESLPEEEPPLKLNRVTILTILFIQDHGSASGAEIDEHLQLLGEENTLVKRETRIFLACAGILVRKKGYLWTLTEKGEQALTNHAS